MLTITKCDTDEVLYTSENNSIFDAVKTALEKGINLKNSWLENDECQMGSNLFLSFYHPDNFSLSKEERDVIINKMCFLGMSEAERLQEDQKVLK